MKTLLMGLFKIMPIIFGLGFVAPLIDQCLSILPWSRDLGLPNLMIGLVIGGIWGIIVTKTGRWV